jgi:glutamyl-Q tRNA(Asp) synthetase
MTRPVLRFAPSPNGLLHLGHALSALTGFEMARTLGGRFLLRIEDIDQNRVRPEFVQAIFQDLEWLGLTWEEPVLFQSAHLADYKAAARRLTDMGLTYPCFASRAQIIAHGDGSKVDPDGALRYPGLWRGRSADDVEARLARGEPYALRLDMGRALELARKKLGGAPLTFTEQSGDVPRAVVCAPERWGDVVLLRKETPSSYLVAVVVDDARQDITHVTRGMDLFPATDVQRLLQVLLDLPQPIYHHHRLITDASGAKLSKSTGAQSLKALRDMGTAPAGIRRLVGGP